jgi:hypothetical protein
LTRFLHICSFPAISIKLWLFVIATGISIHVYAGPPKDTIPPVVTITGPDTEVVQVFSRYIAPKVTAIDNVNGDLSAAVVNNSYLVNIYRIGYYGVVFSVSDSSGNTGFALLTVHVIDTIRPTIKLVGASSQIVSVKSNYSDSGVVAEDNYQKVLTIDTSGTFYDKFSHPRGYTSDTGTYTITYRTADSSGNSISITRLVKVKDFEAPVIKLVGTEDTIVCRYAPYKDKGYVVSDNFESLATLKIDTLGTYTNTELPGYYTRYYIATDHAGNSSRTEKRTIYVRPSDECLNALAMQTKQENTVSVFPNPSKGIFTIATAFPENANITVEDLFGRQILSIQAGPLMDKFDINLAGQPNGIYLLRIYSKGASTTRKLLLSH